MIPALLCSVYIIFLYMKLKREDEAKNEPPPGAGKDSFEDLDARMGSLEKRLATLAGKPGGEG